MKLEPRSQEPRKQPSSKTHVFSSNRSFRRNPGQHRHIIDSPPSSFNGTVGLLASIGFELALFSGSENGTFSCNPFLTQYLHRFDLAANWLCFFKMASLTRPVAVFRRPVIPAKAGIQNSQPLCSRLHSQGPQIGFDWLCFFAHETRLFYHKLCL